MYEHQSTVVRLTCLLQEDMLGVQNPRTDPRSFQVARDEKMADAESSQTRPEDVALNFGDGLSSLTLLLLRSSCLRVSVQNICTPFRFAGCRCHDCVRYYYRKLENWRKFLYNHQGTN